MDATLLLFGGRNRQVKMMSRRGEDRGGVARMKKKIGMDYEPEREKKTERTWIQGGGRARMKKEK